MRPPSGRTKVLFPRFRVEERAPGLTAFIVGFADSPTHYRTLVDRRTARLMRSGSSAELVVVDQDTEAVVGDRDIGPHPRFP